jgi:hypothetical protein
LAQRFPGCNESRVAAVAAHIFILLQRGLPRPPNFIPPRCGWFHLLLEHFVPSSNRCEGFRKTSSALG